jgi:hypothetical protein
LTLELVVGKICLVEATTRQVLPYDAGRVVGKFCLSTL